MTMSDVTNIVVQCDPVTASEGVFLRALDRWIRGRTGTSLRSVNHVAGGDKNMDCSVSIGAFSHFDLMSFWTVLPTFVEGMARGKGARFIMVTATTPEREMYVWRNKIE